MDKGKYYLWILSQIKDLKYANGNLKESLRATIDRYNFGSINEEEFKHSFTWAVADHFGDGCEYETK